MSCNKDKCVCPATSCPRHGKCCQCINFHREKGNLVYCMRALAEKNSK